MTAVTGAAAGATAYADAKLGQILFGQYFKLGFDSADQIGFGSGIQDAFLRESRNRGLRSGESTSGATDRTTYSATCPANGASAQGAPR